MKTKTMMIIALTSAVIGVQAQNKMFEFNVGTLNPKDTPAGLIFSGAYGISVDERVDLSVGFGVFHKGYEDVSEVAKTEPVAGVPATTWSKKMEYSTTLLPFSVNATISIPIQPPLNWFVGAGLSWEILFNKQTNYETNTSASRRFTGFGYQLRGGIEYQIGSRSSLTGELFYNGCKVSGNHEVVQNLPVWDEVNVSGMGIRAGLKVLL
jgi:hypothetical protein